MPFGISFVILDSDESTISDFSRGHITLTEKEVSVTSKGRTPDQSMMIFCSCTDFMDTISNFLQTGQRGCEWIGTGCSFSVKFSKSKNSITISSGKQKIANVSLKQLLLATSEAAEELIMIARANLSSDSAVLPDLENALARLSHVQFE